MIIKDNKKGGQSQTDTTNSSGQDMWSYINQFLDQFGNAEYPVSSGGSAQAQLQNQVQAALGAMNSFMPMLTQQAALDAQKELVQMQLEAQAALQDDAQQHVRDQLKWQMHSGQLNQGVSGPGTGVATGTVLNPGALTTGLTQSLQDQRQEDLMGSLLGIQNQSLAEQLGIQGQAQQNSMQNIFDIINNTSFGGQPQTPPGTLEAHASNTYNPIGDISTRP